MSVKIEISKDSVIFNSETLYLDKGGSYSDIEYAISEKLSACTQNPSKIKQFEKLFSEDLAKCVNESEQIDDLLSKIPTDFCGCSIKSIEKAFEDTPEELKDKVVLESDDYSNDDGFVSHYWTIASDIKKYPYFSAFSLIVQLEAHKSMQRISLKQLDYKKGTAEISYAKAQKDLKALQESLEGCSDAVFVATKTKAAQAKVSKAKKALDEATAAHAAVAFDAQDVLNQLSAAAWDAPLFVATVEKAVKLLNDLN